MTHECGESVITVNYNPDCGCVAGAFEGLLNSETVKEYIQEITKVAIKHNCKRMISDLRRASIDASITDLYFVPKLVVNDKFNLSWKRAIVLKIEDLDKMSFYELASRNRGISLKVFTEMDAAMEWLHSDQSSA